MSGGLLGLEMSIINENFRSIATYESLRIKLRM
jgi:hypothetical protein